MLFSLRFCAISLHSPLCHTVSFDRSAVNIMGFPLYVSFVILLLLDCVRVCLWIVSFWVQWLGIFLFEFSLAIGHIAIFESFENFGSWCLYSSTQENSYLIHLTVGFSWNSLMFFRDLSDSSIVPRTHPVVLWYFSIIL